MFFTPFMINVRQTMSVDLTFSTNLFMLCNATKIFYLSPIMDNFRIQAMSNFIAR